MHAADGGCDAAPLRLSRFGQPAECRLFLPACSREVLRRMLLLALSCAWLNTLAGSAVTLARNGREALDVLEGPESEHIDLVLTDILMPEVGATKAGTASSLQPGPALVACSRLDM